MLVPLAGIRKLGGSLIWICWAWGSGGIFKWWFVWEIENKTREPKSGDQVGDIGLEIIQVVETVKAEDSVQSVQLCPTPCDPMDCSMPGLPIHHQLPECSTSCLSSRRYHPTISSSVVPFSSCLQSFPASGSFPMNWFFTSGGQSIGASASTSVLPINIQDWFPLGLTGLISLQFKGLSRVFSSTTVQKHQFFCSQLYGSTLTGKTIALTRWTFVGKVMSAF